MNTSALFLCQREKAVQAVTLSYCQLSRYGHGVTMYLQGGTLCSTSASSVGMSASRGLLLMLNLVAVPFNL